MPSATLGLLTQSIQTTSDMGTINFDQVIQILAEQVGSLSKDNALLKSLATQQADEIERLKAELSRATQESQKTT